MKKIACSILLMAAMSVPSMLMAQNEDDADAPAKAEAAEDAPSEQEDIIAVSRSKIAELDKIVADFKDPSKSFTRRYESVKNDLEGQYKLIEKSRDKVAELTDRIQQANASEYVFSVIASDRRYEYEEEGTALMNKVRSALGGKEADQIEGLTLFEKVYDEYQGIPGFPAALEQYKKVLERFEKKWSTAKERLSRDRQKYSASQRTKREDEDQSQYKKQIQKMESAGKDINKDWFAPSSAMTNNIPILDALCQHARSCKRYTVAPQSEYQGKVPELVRSYWTECDDAVAKMRAGEVEAALEMINESKSYQELTGVPRACMPDKYKQDIRKQHSELRGDMRRRMTEVRQLLRERDREVLAIERVSSTISSRLENVAQEVESEKADLEAKAEEEAARKAEEEAERAEEEAERAAAEGDDKADSDKPAKKKKRKKKSAAKKDADNED